MDNQAAATSNRPKELQVIPTEHMPESRSDIATWFMLLAVVGYAL